MPKSRVLFAAVAHLVITAEIALAQAFRSVGEFQVNMRTLAEPVRDCHRGAVER